MIWHGLVAYIYFQFTDKYFAKLSRLTGSEKEYYQNNVYKKLMANKPVNEIFGMDYICLLNYLYKKNQFKLNACRPKWIAVNACNIKNNITHV